MSLRAGVAGADARGGWPFGSTCRPDMTLDSYGCGGPMASGSFGSGICTKARGDDASSGLILLLADSNDLQRAIWQWPLQGNGLFPRRGQPHLDLGRFGQNDRHGLHVDRAHDIVGLGGQEAKEVDGFEAGLDLPDAGPLWNPYASEEGEGAAVIEGEPGVAVLLAVWPSRIVELGEAGERHDATVLNAHPPIPVLVPLPLLRVVDIADIGRAAVRLHLEQLGKVDDLALILELGRTLFGVLHQGELARRQTPADLCQFAAVRRVPDNGRLIIREDAGLGLEVADIGMDALDVADHPADSLGIRGVAVEVAHRIAP